MVKLTVYGASDTGLVRKSNDDAFVMVDLADPTERGLLSGPLKRFQLGPQGALLAISDGIGGHRAGELASALVLGSLLRSMRQGATAPGGEALEAAVETANHEVWQATHGTEDNPGATLTALLVEGTAIHIAQVGDSRAYLLRGGVMVQLTHDQSHTQILVDAGAISADEARDEPTKRVVLQAMGQKPAVSVALLKLSLRRNDSFLICSDGLSDRVSVADMTHLILTAPSLDAACDKLVALANERGGEDNITVIIGGVSGDELPPPRGRGRDPRDARGPSRVRRAAAAVSETRSTGLTHRRIATKAVGRREPHVRRSLRSEKR